MKTVDIAFKDMRQSFRNRGAIVFMFVIPILITVLFYFMFGNIAGGDEEFTLPVTTVALVNLDDAADIEASNFEASSLAGKVSGFDSMGAFLGDTLKGEDLAEFLQVREMNDAAAARTAVDNQEAGMAVIIPRNFSGAIMGEGETAEVELYRDPTLIIGPAVVSSIVSQIIEGMSAGNIGMGVTISQMVEAGGSITQDTVQELIDATMETSSAQQEGGLVVMQAPPGQESGNELAQLLALILGGMMVFYAFFTGANVLNSILTEQEKGTLQRLFTTPTSHMEIFSGKFIATVIILSVQIGVLLLFGRLAFQIQWGDPLPVAIAAAGLVLIASTTGLFLVSLLKDPRQGGVIFGGLLTLTGMIGLFTVFTAGSPNTPPALETVSLLVPQGWAMRSFRQAMDGNTLPQIGLTFAIILLWSTAFFFIGQYRLRKRFD
jgi:ABC-2 type transport system permease protein